MFIQCKYPHEYQKYEHKLLCQGINVMFNPVAYLINTAVIDKKHIPNFVEKVNTDPTLLEKYTHLALNILNSCLDKKKQTQFGKLKRLLFSKLFSRIATGFRTLVGILLEDDFVNFRDEFITLPPTEPMVNSSCDIKPPNDFESAESINSMKFSKPRVKIDNPYPDENISFVETLRRIAQHCDKKQSFDVEDSIIKENRLKAKKKYHIRGLKKSTDKLEEEVTVSSFIETMTEFCFLPVKIAGQTFKFLIDTGASRSLILDILIPPNSQLIPTETKIKVAGASPKIVRGTSTFDFTLFSDTSDITINHRFLALSDCNGFAGIIGQDLLKSEISRSLAFKENAWQIDYQGSTHSIPFSTNESPNQAVFKSITNIKIKPRSEMVVPVNCSYVSLDPVNNYFVTAMNNPMFGVEVPPSIVKINRRNNLFISYVKVVNFNEHPIVIPMDTDLATVDNYVPINSMDLKVSPETFLEAHNTVSSEPILEEIYVNSFKDLPSKENAKSDVKSFLDQGVINYDAKPDCETFRTFSDDIQKSFKKVNKNIPLKNVSDDQYKGSNIGYKENLAKLEKDNPNLVLEDDYLEKIGDKCQTNIGSTTVKYETYSLDDIDISHIPKEYQSKYRALFDKYEDCFAKNNYDIGLTKLVTHHLQVNEVPKQQKKRFIGGEKLEFAKKAVDQLLKAQVIRPISTPCTASNLVLVAKHKTVRDNTKASQLLKDDSDISGYRLAQDLREVNAKIVNTARTISICPEKLISALANKMVTNLDIINAYWHIPLSKTSQPLTSFYLGEQIYCWNRLSQGLQNACSSYQNFNTIVYSDKVLEQAKAEINIPKDMNVPYSFESFLRYYMDDSWNFSELDNHEQHLVHLELQLYAIKNANLKISPPKCKIATTSVMVLGLQLNTENAELYISQKKASSILSWPKPSSLYEVQSRLCS